MATLELDKDQWMVARRIAQVGYWELDVLSNQMVWTDDFSDIYGLTETDSENLGTLFLQRVHPDDREHIRTTVEHAGETGQAFNVYYRVEHPDGVRIIHSRGQPQTDDEGTVVRIIGTFQDVTDLKESESQLMQQAQRLAALGNLGQTVVATLNVDKLYDQILEQLPLLLAIEHVALFLCGDDGHKLVAASPTVADSTFIIEEFPPIVQHAIDCQQAIWSHDPELADALPAPLYETVKRYDGGFIAAPLLIQDKTLGAVIVLSSSESNFRSQDLQVVEAAANWSAIALDNARQYEALQEKVEELEIVIEVNRAIAQEVELDKILALIVEAAETMVCDADWCVLHLYNESRDLLVPVAASGVDLKTIDYTVELGTGVAGEVFDSGKVINVGDLQTDGRLLPFDRSQNTRSLLVAPLKNEDSLLGTISVQCDIPCAYSDKDVRLLEALGLQAFIAIQSGRAYENVQSQQQQLQQLSRKLVQIQEEERKQISRDLHDGVGQDLTALRISLALMREKLAPESESLLLTRTQEMIELTEQVIDQVRKIVYDLRPPALMTANLDSALCALGESFTRQTGISVNYTGPTEMPECPDLVAVNIYRIVQEALSNVAKHAQVAHVEVALRFPILAAGKLRPQLQVCVADEGRGFAQYLQSPFNSGSGGLGLVAMHERCQAIDADLMIDSAPGVGTTITVSIELAPAASIESIESTSERSTQSM